jgi:S-DNA-T family DNA segregation ATPase FtsK/SpoIIIE
MTVARGRKIQPDEDEEDEEDDERVGFFSLGMVTHALLSAQARVGRLFRRTARPVSVSPAQAGTQRVEPRMMAPSRAPTIRMDDPVEDDGDDVEVIQPQAAAPRKVATRAARRSSSGYQLPSLDLLAKTKQVGQTLSSEQIQENAVALESVLGDFGVKGEIINARPGPVVTLYELEPAPGIKSSRVIGLADDIARSMSAVSARVAVVSGRNAIGIELPNPTREKVYFREQLSSKEYDDTAAKLPLCLGKTIGGEPVVVDLARMPHLLIAGTTGSGKSVAINTMLLSLLYKLRPDQCRLIMVDPKMLELSVYDGIPHLLTPVVTDPKKAVVALKWAVREMEGRYKKMSKLGVRNIDGYNIRVGEAKAKGESLTRTVHTGYDKESGQAIYEKEELDLEPLPYIVVVVDEMADLMMVAGKDIEGAVQRLAQMARAAGIHVILATQRPSVDVITGTIKANFPTRISFQVTSKIDSRTILGEQGAEQLLGQGDMLYMAGGGRISRVHGPFVSDDEVEKVVRHLKSQGAPEYLEEVTASTEEDENGDGPNVFDASGMGTEGAGDLYEQAVAIVRRDRKASTSYIQRRLQIGYNRAASLMERLEQEGVVGQPNHAGKREILLPEIADQERY